jgi:hypothetical protein
MTEFLDALERQLVDVVERHASAAPVASPERADGSSCFRSRRLRVRRPQLALRRIALGTLVCALVAAVALVSSGALGRGTPARPATRGLGSTRRTLFPHGLLTRGLPSLGHSRLANLNVADPAGGAPWGMRIVHTATNLVCLQIGQLERGRLRPLGGVVGDGVVHTLPPPAPPAGVIGNGLLEAQVERAAPHGLHPPEVESCRPAGAAFIGYGSGTAAHAPRSARPGGRSRRRTIAFGLLGPQALSVSYRFDGRSRSQAVERGTGAYLVVLPAATAAGTVAVTYRDGETVCPRATAPASAGPAAAAPATEDRCPAR